MIFWKMHGLGNDYMVINDFDCSITEETRKYLVKLCKQRFAVGADGLLLIQQSNIADVRMRIFNIDGGEAEMCGNGIRCLAKFCFEQHLITKSQIDVETLAGIKKCTLTIDQGTGDVTEIEVDMGVPLFDRKDIPMLGDGTFINQELIIEKERYQATCLSVGNPHCVIFIEDIENFPVETIGSIIENHTLFPKRVNVEFVQILNDHELVMRVWERGVGETSACGTGACASVVASKMLNKTSGNVRVQLKGGPLTISFGERIIMTGPAEKIFEGSLFQRYKND